MIRNFHYFFIDIVFGEWFLLLLKFFIVVIGLLFFIIVWATVTWILITWDFRSLLENFMSDFLFLWSSWRFSLFQVRWISQRRLLVFWVQVAKCDHICVSWRSFKVSVSFNFETVINIICPRDAFFIRWFLLFEGAVGIEFLDDCLLEVGSLYSTYSVLKTEFFRWNLWQVRFWRLWLSNSIRLRWGIKFFRIRFRWWHL